MFCPKCGTELPDDAVFCMKCGTNLQAEPQKRDEAPKAPVLAPIEAKALKCPSCGAPITPKFGEMIISCEYCGSAITLGNEGWRSIQKQTMLPIKFPDQQQVLSKIHDLMDRGLLHRHLQESSKLEEMGLSLIPYWIVSVSARTSVVASDVAVQAGEIAATAVLAGMMGSAMGGRHRMGGFAGPMIAGTVLGSTMGPGRGTMKTHEVDNNYNFPIVALKAFSEYQPRDYQFNLAERTFFDMAAVPKGVKVLNGDVGEEAAKYQAKTMVDQLQSDRAHAQYHMIQQLHTQVDVSETELLHAPIWFVRYDRQGKKIVLIIDGSSGGVINTVGL